MGDFPPYDELDTNADGGLTWNEIDRLRETKVLPYVPLGAFADKDGDGVVSRDEYAALEVLFGGSPDR